MASFTEPEYRAAGGTVFTLENWKEIVQKDEFFYNTYIELKTSIVNRDDDDRHSSAYVDGSLTITVHTPLTTKALYTDDYDAKSLESMVTLAERMNLNKSSVQKGNKSTNMSVAYRTFIESLLIHLFQPMIESGYFREDKNSKFLRACTAIATACMKLSEPPAARSMQFDFTFPTNDLAFEFLRTDTLEDFFKSMLEGVKDASMQSFFAADMFDLSKGVNLTESFVTVKLPSDRFSGLRKISSHYTRYHIMQIRTKRSFFVPFFTYMTQGLLLPDEKNMFMQPEMLGLSDAYTEKKNKEYAFNQMTYWTNRFQSLQAEPQKRRLISLKQIFKEYCDNDHVITGGTTLSKCIEYALNHEVRHHRTLRHKYRISWSDGIFRKHKDGKKETKISGPLSVLQDTLKVASHSNGISYPTFLHICSLIRTELLANEAQQKYDFKEPKDNQKCRDALREQNAKWGPRTRVDFLAWCNSSLRTKADDRAQS